MIMARVSPRSTKTSHGKPSRNQYRKRRDKNNLGPRLFHWQRNCAVHGRCCRVGGLARQQSGGIFRHVDRSMGLVVCGTSFHLDTGAVGGGVCHVWRVSAARGEMTPSEETPARFTTRMIPAPPQAAWHFFCPAASGKPSHITLYHTLVFFNLHS